MKVLGGLRKPKTSSVHARPQDGGTTYLVTRSRSRNRRSILSLPEELLLHLLKELHVKDLLSMRSAHPCFRDLIDSHYSVWTTVSFMDAWPSQPNIQHFERAAKYGNVEALIKLGIAYLYNEGLPGDFEGRRITVNGEKAAEMFCQVECLTPHTAPFTWLFIRPPWASSGACCKECVFTNIKQYVQKRPDPCLLICLAKTLELLSLDENEQQVMDYLATAARQRSPVACYLLWKYTSRKRSFDLSAELQCLRELRDVASLGHIDAQLALCRCYARHQYGGIAPHHATAFVCHFLQSLPPSDLQSVMKTRDLTPSMRYILLDWLVEVACMKDFATLTLHMAISMVDRYLRLHQTTRSRLQLLGVSAMVLCSRFLGKDIITIREAAWLTDNTYKYEDVVRMMGEVTATLHGQIRVVTSLDLVEIIGLAADNDRRTQCLAEYVCELVLLQCDIGTYSQAQVAAACVLLARLLHRREVPWSTELCQLTGFTMRQLAGCVQQLHDKCFLANAMVDHREMVLQAVKQRYQADKFCGVGATVAMSHTELCSILGVSEEVVAMGDATEELKLDCAVNDLIMSPCHTSKRRSSITQRRPSHTHDCGREDAATPTLQLAADDSALLDESVQSGYDADKEDEEESFLDFDDLPSSDSELTESVWGFDSDRHTYNKTAMKTIASPESAGATSPSVYTLNSWRLGSQPTCLSLSTSFGHAFTVTSTSTPTMFPHLTRASSNLARSVKLSCSVTAATASPSCTRQECESASSTCAITNSITGGSRLVPTVAARGAEHRTALRTLTNTELATVQSRSVSGKRKRTQSIIGTEKRIHVFSTL
ncbi:Cyclin-F [Lamellibrachia satsuma]|nr:Cyclin-F [Lamellibrachia satsuma]